MAMITRTLTEPLRAFGQWYTATAERAPLRTALWTSLLKTSAADLFAQKVVEKKEELDLRRHAVFCIFGFVYLGGFQYYLYNHLFKRVCNPLKNIGAFSYKPYIKVFLDQGIHHPFMYFPVFYTLKSTVEGHPNPLLHAKRKYENEIWDSCKALWTIWVPCQIVNFRYVPSHMTIPFVCGVSFAWTTVLSVMQSAYDQLHEQEMIAVSGKTNQAIASLIPPAEGPILLAGTAAMAPRGVGLQEIARAKDGENV